MDKEAIQYYQLNQERLRIRNSKEYFIGERICRYLQKLKRVNIPGFFSLLFSDIYRVSVKKKRNPTVNEMELKDLVSPQRIAIYTAVYGRYDKILDPLYKDPNCDYYIFTDVDVPEDSIWKKVDYKSFPPKANTPLLKNRYIKFFPQKLFPNYKYSFYVDGNIQIVSSISAYINEFNSPIGIGMHKHPSNINLYEEVYYNEKLKKITRSEGKALIKLYKSIRMPKNYGMFECNVILRDHENEKCLLLMDEWWNALINGVKRDQLYFTYLLYKNDIKFSNIYLLGNNINANPMFIRHEHNS